MKDYYILLKGEPFGPMDWAELREMVSTAKLNGDTEYWKEGWSERRKLEELQELISKGSPPEKPRWFSQDPTERFGFRMIVLVLVMGGLFTLAVQFYEAAPTPEAMQARALKEAKSFVLDHIVGARKINYASAHPGDNENSFRVDLTVDGLNKFGGPTRDRLALEMRYDGQQWRGTLLNDRLTLAQ